MTFWQGKTLSHDGDDDLTVNDDDYYDGSAIMILLSVHDHYFSYLIVTSAQIHESAHEKAKVEMNSLMKQLELLKVC